MIMLQIPTSTFIKQQAVQQRAPVLLPTTHVQVMKARQQLKHMMLECKTTEEMLQRLSNWQGTQETVLHESEESAADFVVWEQVLQAKEKQNQKRYFQNQLQEEFDLIIEVGSHVETSEQLRDYLAKQIPAYVNHWQKYTKGSAKEKNQQAENLKSQTLQAALLRAICHENLTLASELLTSEKNILPEDFIHACSAKLNWIFAKQESDKYWEEATQKNPQNLTQAARYARDLNNEKNEVLHRLIEDMIYAKEQSVLCEQYKQRALLVSALYTLSSREALRLLHEQTDLSSNDLEQYYQMAKDLDNPAKPHTAESFIKLYFTGNTGDIFRAYKQKQLSAQDVFRLLEQYYLRLCGKQNLEMNIRCKKIAHAGEKLEFPQELIMQTQYELLSADDPSVEWGRIENLIK